MFRYKKGLKRIKKSLMILTSSKKEGIVRHIDTTSLKKSADRLVEAAEGYNKRADYALWFQVLKRESWILLRRVFWFWLKLRFRNN